MEERKNLELLLIAHDELLLKHRELVKCAAELTIANEELIYEHGEKEKRASELIIANKELIFQNNEKEKMAEELIIANKELILQNKEKENKAIELAAAYDGIIEAEKFQIEHIHDLESMMFIISHKVRQPVAHILGISNVLEIEGLSPKELKRITCFFKQSAQLLDDLTKELAIFIHQKIRKK